MVGWLKDNWIGIVMTTVILALVVGLVAALYFCLHQLDEGLVVGKDYTPAGVRPYMLYINGKMRWSAIYAPEQYKIKVQGVTADGKARAEWWSLKKETYTMISIGDYVCVDKGSIIIYPRGGTDE